MSIRTIALTLEPTDEQAAALATLQAAFSAACNHASGVAWQRREFRQLALQKLVYRDLGERFGVLAQHAMRAVGGPQLPG